MLLVRDAQTGELLHTDDWTAAYTTPIDVGEGLVRADGSHGLQSVDSDGVLRWRRNYDVFALHPGNSAILVEHGNPLVVAPRRDGIVDVLDIDSGALRSSTAVGHQAERRPTLGLADIMVIGLATGTILAVDASGAVLWRHDLGSAVETLAAVRIRRRSRLPPERPMGWFACSAWRDP